MKIIPAIDLIEQQCVRLYKGEYSKKKVYDEDPAGRARLWQDGGAELIHIVDLEGAKGGRRINFDAIKKIRHAVSCRLEVGGGIRSIEDAEIYLNIGIDRIILGTIAYQNALLVDTLASKYPGRIIVGADGKQGKVAIEGWEQKGEADVFQFAASFNQLDLAGILFTDVDTDGALTGPNIPGQQKMGSVITNPLIASGGVSCLDDLHALLKADIANIDGIIIGTALYEEKFSLPEAIKAVS